jgi:hypothetical protein
LEWKGISLHGIRTIGLVAVRKVYTISGLFIPFAVRAVADFSTNFHQVSGTPFTIQFSDFIASPMRLRVDGFPKSALPNA